MMYNKEGIFLIYLLLCIDNFEDKNQKVWEVENRVLILYRAFYFRIIVIESKYKVILDILEKY